MERPVSQRWTATVRTVVFALMAAGVLVSIVAGGPLPFAQRLQPQRAALLRRGGDNVMLGYYLVRARGVPSDHAQIFLVWAGDLYQAALEADPSDFRISLSAGMVLRELGDTSAARPLFPPLRPGQFDERTRHALGGVYALALSAYPALSAVERSRDYLAGIGPGALLIADGYRANERPDLAQRTLENAARRGRPLVTRLAVVGIVNGLIVLSGMVMVLCRVVRWRRKAAAAAGEFPTSAHWGSRESVEALVLWMFLSVATGSAAVSLAPVSGAPPAYLLIAPGLSSAVLAIGWVWVAARFRGGFGWDLARGLRRVGIGVATAGLVVAPALAVYGLLRLLMGVKAADSPVLPLLMAPETAVAKVFLLAAIGLAVPALEETLFRGILFGGLRRRWSYWPAALVSATIFAVVHQHLAGFVTYLLLGLIFAYLFEASRSLVTCWAAHAAFNIFNLMLLFALFG
jgi:membrane protease YdiL (CAAX protease family)